MRSALLLMAFGTAIAVPYGCSSSKPSGVEDAGSFVDGDTPNGEPDGGAADGTAKDTGATADQAGAFSELPVSGGTDAPTVATMTLKCANSRVDLSHDPESGASYPGAFVLMGVVSDPLGFSNLDGISQNLTLFDNLDAGGAETHTFKVDALASGTAFFDPGDYFRGYFEGAAGAAARAAFCGQTWWPGEVTIANKTGKVTKKKIRVPVVN